MHVSRIPAKGHQAPFCDLGAPLYFRTPGPRPPISYSNGVNPVMLPDGRERLATNPPATGSVTFRNTIGPVSVAACRATIATVPLPMITAGERLTSSIAADR